MLVVYVVLLTVGVVLTVPAVLRALDGHEANPIADGIGIAAFFAGISGLVVRQVGGTAGVATIVALAVGLAAGVVHPELFARLGADTDDGAGGGADHDAGTGESARRATADPR